MCFLLKCQRGQELLFLENNFCYKSAHHTWNASPCCCCGSLWRKRRHRDRNHRRCRDQSSPCPLRYHPAGHPALLSLPRGRGTWAAQSGRVLRLLSGPFRPESGARAHGWGVLPPPLLLLLTPGLPVALTASRSVQRTQPECSPPRDAFRPLLWVPSLAKASFTWALTKAHWSSVLVSLLPGACSRAYAFFLLLDKHPFLVSESREPAGEQRVGSHFSVMGAGVEAHLVRGGLGFIFF